MSEFQGLVHGGAGYRKATGNELRRVLSGDIESVRERLIYALERFDYSILSEQPLIAKPRGEVSTSAWDVLKCVKSVTIGLKALNPTSTLVSFDYEIVNPFATKGDRQTVDRQAEAVIALAQTRPVAATCISCGSNNVNDSRFCRACGTPTYAGEPAELEVLRLTHGARYAYQNITAALILALAVAAIAVPLFLSGIGSKGLMVLIVGGILAVIWLLHGMSRLHRTLNPGKGLGEGSASSIPYSIPTARAASLPPPPAQASVTEGTTELLATTSGKPAPVPVRSSQTNTAQTQR